MRFIYFVQILNSISRILISEFNIQGEKAVADKTEKIIPEERDTLVDRLQLSLPVRTRLTEQKFLDQFQEPTTKMADNWLIYPSI